MLKKLSSTFFAISTVIISGCSAFRPATQLVNVTCSQPSAILTINGQRYSSPAQVKMKRNRDISIQAFKPGYAPYQRTIGHHFNGTGALDAVGTILFLVPGVGLFCPGAFSLDETDVFITLFETNPSTQRATMN